MIDSKIPAGSLEHKWTDYKGHCKLVNPANKRKLESGQSIDNNDLSSHSTVNMAHLSIWEITTFR